MSEFGPEFQGLTQKVERLVPDCWSDFEGSDPPDGGELLQVSPSVEMRTECLTPGLNIEISDPNGEM